MVHFAHLSDQHLPYYTCKLKADPSIPDWQSDPKDCSLAMIAKALAMAGFSSCVSLKTPAWKGVVAESDFDVDGGGRVWDCFVHRLALAGLVKDDGAGNVLVMDFELINSSSESAAITDATGKQQLFTTASAWLEDSQSRIVGQSARYTLRHA